MADPTPRMPLLPDYYAILQVHPQASPAVIKKAYRTLLLEGGQHPDRGGELGRAALLTEAYEVLSDPTRREDYDRWYHRRAPEAPPPSDGEVALVVLCPACATKNRVRSQAVLAIARCSRCRQPLSRLPAPGRRRGRQAAPVPLRWVLLGGLGLGASFAAAWWALSAGPLWVDPLAQADRLARADQLPAARAVLGQALRRDPDNPRLHEKLGETFLLEQRYQEASTHFAQAGRLSPENAHVLAREGRALMLLGRLRDSEEAYRAALRLDPAHGAALADLAQLLARAGRHEEAVACLGRALRLEPSAEFAHRLGALHRQRGQAAPAIAAFQEALRLDPQHRPSMVQLAELHHARGEHALAAARYAAACRLRQGDLATHLKLAGLYEHLGETRLAVAEWRVCLRQGQGDKAVVARARRALSRLRAAAG
ncbi:MAG: tetratricopeptide repeat protein [Candidatus Sericytochromatia bacterium]|nr:tetratricopeptide repeat protein [Candidatus Sericytochromatia bacterium]